MIIMIIMFHQIDFIFDLEYNNCWNILINCTNFLLVDFAPHLISFRSLFLSLRPLRLIEFCIRLNIFNAIICSVVTCSTSSLSRITGLFYLFLPGSI